MFGATDREVNELAVVVAQSAFWSNVLHVQNYDHKELEQIGKHVSKQNSQNSIVCATYFGVYTEGTKFISNSSISRCINLS